MSSVGGLYDYPSIYNPTKQPWLYPIPKYCNARRLMVDKIAHSESLRRRLRESDHERHQKNPVLRSAGAMEGES